MNNISLYAEHSLIYPFNNTTTFNQTIKISYKRYTACNNYNIQISKEESFSSIIFSSTTTDTFFNYTFDTTGVFYIRMKPICGSSWNSSKLVILSKNELSQAVECWFSADSNITINTGRVSRWGDFFENSNRFAIQNTNNNRPILSYEKLINNKPTVQFKPQTTISFMDFNKQFNINDFTIIALYMVDTSNNSTFQQFLSGPSSNGYYAENDIANEGFGILSTDGINPTQKIATSVQNIDSLFTIYMATKSNLFKNLQSLSIIGGLNDSLRYSRIGSRINNSSANFKGKVAEIMIFNKVLEEQILTTIHNYLFTKYAPPVNLGADIVFGSTFSDSYTLDASNRFIKYLWSTGDTTQTIQVQSCGTYSVTTTDVFGRTSTDEIQVYPYNRLNNDTLYICDGDSITIYLNANNSLNKIWSNGSTLDSIVIKNEGTYTVSITDVN
ncbi:MAG: hypothetical protein KC414_10125, partial [Romboutsia sp.]|nr:hypothetical protein [Romboutsia sp.]